MKSCWKSRFNGIFNRGGRRSLRRWIWSWMNEIWKRSSSGDEFVFSCQSRLSFSEKIPNRSCRDFTLICSSRRSRSFRTADECLERNHSELNWEGPGGHSNWQLTKRNEVRDEESWSRKSSQRLRTNGESVGKNRGRSSFKSSRFERRTNSGKFRVQWRKNDEDGHNCWAWTKIDWIRITP